MIKNFFLMSNPYLPCSSLKPLPLILLLYAFVNSPSPSFLYALSKMLKPFAASNSDYQQIPSRSLFTFKLFRVWLLSFLLSPNPSSSLSHKPPGSLKLSEKKHLAFSHDLHQNKQQPNCLQWVHFTLDVQPWALASHPRNLLLLPFPWFYFTFPLTETSE